LGDDVAQALEERLDAFECRLQGLDGEVRSRLNALERRVQELEDAQAQGDRAQGEEDAPSPVRIVLPPAPPTEQAHARLEPLVAPASDKRARHAEYMRRWRVWRKAQRDVHA
jgi:hypothetical protein